MTYLGKLSFKKATIEDWLILFSFFDEDHDPDFIQPPLLENLEGDSNNYRSWNYLIVSSEKTPIAWVQTVFFHYSEKYQEYKNGYISIEKLCLDKQKRGNLCASELLAAIAFYLKSSNVKTGSKDVMIRVKKNNERMIKTAIKSGFKKTDLDPGEGSEDHDVYILK